MKRAFFKYLNNELSLKAITIAYLFFNALFTYSYFKTYDINFFAFADASDIISMLLFSIIQQSPIFFNILCFFLITILLITYKTHSKKRGLLRLLKLIIVIILILLLMITYLRIDMFSANSLKESFFNLFTYKNNIKEIKGDVDLNIFTIIIILIITYITSKRTTYARSLSKFEKKILIKFFIFLGICSVLIEHAKITAKFEFNNKSKIVKIYNPITDKFETKKCKSISKIGDFNLIIENNKTSKLIKSDNVISIE